MAVNRLALCRNIFAWLEARGQWQSPKWINSVSKKSRQNLDVAREWNHNKLKRLSKHMFTGREERMLPHRKVVWNDVRCANFSTKQWPHCHGHLTRFFNLTDQPESSPLYLKAYQIDHLPALLFHLSSPHRDVFSYVARFWIVCLPSCWPFSGIAIASWSSISWIPSLRCGPFAITAIWPCHFTQEWVIFPNLTIR